MTSKQVEASLKRIEAALGIPPQKPITVAPPRYRMPTLMDDLDLEAKIRAAVPLKGTAAELAKILIPGLNAHAAATLLGIMARQRTPAGLEFTKHRKDHGPVVWTIQGEPACPPDPST